MNRDNELYPFRRHLRRCEFFGPGGREARMDKCQCPFHVDGLHHGERVRESLRTRSRQVADRRLAALTRKLDDRRRAAGDDTVGVAQRTVSEAVDRFLRNYGELDQNRKFRGTIEYATWRKYRTKLNLLLVFCKAEGISELTDVTVDVLEDFRRTRDIGLVTSKVELQTLRTFFAYFVSRKWISINPAKEIKTPRNIKPNEVVPYTLREESLILAACDQIGGAKYQRSAAVYERLRARAMVMLLRHTALRVSDVCTLKKDAVSWDGEKSTWRVFLHTQKTGDPVFLPIPTELKLVLDALPLPRNAGKDCPYYFWNGHSARRAVVGIAERTLAAVFNKSGVKNAHAHRYRHTLATRLLAGGATFELVADILGNSPAVVRKHYGKWSKGRQDNIDRVMIAHFQTAQNTVPVTPKVSELALEYRFSVDSIYAWVRAGLIPADCVLRIGNSIRIESERFDALLRAGELYRPRRKAEEKPRYVREVASAVGLSEDQHTTRLANGEYQNRFVSEEGRVSNDHPYAPGAAEPSALTR